MILRLDHVNLRTADVDRLVRFYVDVIGLRVGDRPAFSFPGAWLYARERPILHLVGEPQQAIPAGPLTLEHFALAAEGDGVAAADEFVARLDAHAISYRRTRQTGSQKIVINLQDPDGNRLHVDFDSLSDADGSPASGL